MNTLGISVVLGLLVGVWAQIPVRLPLCDSPEAEEAALAARDYLNAQHTHGYKYDLNRIEDIKVYTTPTGEETYSLEIDLLETDCHVMDPTPLPNCTVRPKILTAVEGDCDVLLKKVGGVLTVVAFKCKTEESREDFCVGCASLLPLNDTTALKFVDDSLVTFNNLNPNKTYLVLEVGRMLSQVVAGGPQYLAEYVITEANCTGVICEPLNDPVAERGICTAKGFSAQHQVDCKIFAPLVPIIEANINVTAFPSFPKLIHVRGDDLSHKHGFGHHKLTALHNPQQSGLLSAESAESDEVVPVVPVVMFPAAPAADPAAPAADPAVALESPDSMERLKMFKRDVPASPVNEPVLGNPATHGTVPLVPVCPGKIRFYK